MESIPLAGRQSSVRMPGPVNAMQISSWEHHQRSTSARQVIEMGGDVERAEEDGRQPSGEERSRLRMNRVCVHRIRLHDGGPAEPRARTAHIRCARNRDRVARTCFCSFPCSVTGRREGHGAEREMQGARLGDDEGVEIIIGESCVSQEAVSSCPTLWWSAWWQMGSVRKWVEEGGESWQRALLWVWECIQVGGDGVGW
jgi:hypothetical protein